MHVQLVVKIAELFIFRLKSELIIVFFSISSKQQNKAILEKFSSKSAKKL